ncbi:MAG: PD-(D/E)XK nuclease family protein [Clostridia bacterium]|nr:PD-(D/E)XK nuclease family protein [Clostridia bacterium]
MFQLILAPASGGKTTEMLRRAAEDIRNGEAVVFLVPEQFSFETERAVLHLLGEQGMDRISVFSFSRLCEHVEIECGGIAGHSLSDADKLILLNRAMMQAADSLKLWRRYIGSAGFLAGLLNSIEEFKQAAISPDDLRRRAEETDSPVLKSKLEDIATIFSFYQALLGERFMDPSERLDRLYTNLAESAFFVGKKVYIDSFNGFTGQQYRIIDRILSQADALTVSMTLSGESPREWDIFTNVRKCIHRLKRMAQDRGVRIEKDCVLSAYHGISASLRGVEKLLSTDAAESVEPDGCLTLCLAETPYDEARFAARNIRRLVRENPGYRYRDFVIIARNTAAYEEAVATFCEQNGVACFLDKRQSLNSLPPAILAETAVSFAERPSGELLFRFYKTGMGVLSSEELFLLEKYCVLWNLKIKDWSHEWMMNPGGFTTTENKDDMEVLQKLNELRCRAFQPLDHFRRSFSGSARQRVASLMELFRVCRVDDSFRALSEEYRQNGGEDRSQLLTQAWDSLMSVLNSIAFCCGDADMSTVNFRKTLQNATALTTVGVAPQFLDEVIFGAADRIRPHRPKVAFILGANQGIFPKTVTPDGLLAQNERAKLIALGLEISDQSIHDAIDEELLVYVNLCCASERSFVSCSKRSSDGKALEPSAFFTKIADWMNQDIATEPNSLSLENAPETAESAFSEACLRASADPAGSQTIFEALSLTGENKAYLQRLHRVQTSLSDEKVAIRSETAAALYGKTIHLSASKLNVYHSCPFTYFCKYGLKAQKIQPANFDTLQRGTIVHYCLQRFITEAGDRIGALSDEEVAADIRKFAEEYLDLVPGYRSVENARMRFLVDNLVRSTGEVAVQICHEFAQSSFRPVACELGFGWDKDYPPLQIDFNGGRISLSGSIDRVDRWNGYVRIVDYKTGKKLFRLPDVLFGQNMQMLLYLYALSRSEGYEEMKPAGIFYMPALRNRKEEGLAMNGLMPAEEDLVRAMERENQGEFIPKYRVTQKGTLDSRYASAFIEQEDFEVLFRHMDRVLQSTGQELLSGRIDMMPRNGLSSNACEYCDFSAICGRSDKENLTVPNMKNAEVIEELRKEMGENGEEIH